MILYESKYGTYRYSLSLDKYRCENSSIYYRYWNEPDECDYILKKPIQVWLRDIIGDQNYQAWTGQISFIKKEDAMLFKLMWS